MKKKTEVIKRQIKKPHITVGEIESEIRYNDGYGMIKLIRKELKALGIKLRSEPALIIPLGQTPHKEYYLSSQEKAILSEHLRK